MSEPMVSHDCVAFYLLSEDVSASVKVVQSGQGADEVLGGYDWYPPLASIGRRATRPSRRTRTCSSTVAGQALSKLLIPRLARSITTRRPPSSASGFGRPGAETAVDAALRNDTTIMLVDDPVKRVDNMTMAWGLEARVPFLDHEVVELAGRIPPELKLADGGKGVLKQASRGVVPDEVIDRTKGYFPVPAIRQLEGPYLDRVREALSDPQARRRGLFRGEAVRKMLADPNTTRTTLGLERAVAAGPARDVAADIMTSADWSPIRRTGLAERAGRRLGQLGGRRSRRPATGWPSSATGAARPCLWVQDLPAPGSDHPARADDDQDLGRSGDRGQLVGRRRLAGLQSWPPAAASAPRCGWSGPTGRTLG